MTILSDLMNVKKLLKEIQENCGQSYIALSISLKADDQNHEVFLKDTLRLFSSSPDAIIVS